MTLVGTIAIAALIGLALTAASLAIGRPVSDEASGVHLRGAPAAFVVDTGVLPADEVETDFIIPQTPRVGPVHIVPALYDWIVWSLLALVMVGAYVIGRRRSRMRPASTTDLPRSSA